MAPLDIAVPVKVYLGLPLGQAESRGDSAFSGKQRRILQRRTRTACRTAPLAEALPINLH